MYRPVMNGDTALLINLQNPRESFQVSDRSGKLNRASVPAALARQLTGQGQPAAGQVAAQVGGAARRGRPAGQPNAPQPAAPAAAGNVNVGASMQAAGIMNGFMDLPRSILPLYYYSSISIPTRIPISAITSTATTQFGRDPSVPCK